MVAKSFRDINDTSAIAVNEWFMLRLVMHRNPNSNTLALSIFANTQQGIANLTST
ncbi:MAG TPA: hypothetical protein V6D43_16890 [Candidatus Sericytochromatia bacterium]